MKHFERAEEIEELYRQEKEKSLKMAQISADQDLKNLNHDKWMRKIFHNLK